MAIPLLPNPQVTSKVDLSSVFQAAANTDAATQNARLSRQKRKDAEAAAVREKDLQAALFARSQGQSGMLKAHFPGVAQKMDKADLDFASEEQKQRQMLTKNVFGNAAGILAANPEALPAMRQQVAAMVAEGKVIDPQLAEDASVETVVDVFNNIAQGLKPEKIAFGGRKKSLRRAANTFDFFKDEDILAAVKDPETREKIRRKARMIEAEDLRRSTAKAKAGALTLNTGDKNTTSFKSQLQKSYFSATKLLADLKVVEGMGNTDDFLTYLGKAEGWAKDKADKMGASEFLELMGFDQVGFLDRRTKFRQTVNQIFNDYRREVTGAQAAVQELEILKQDILSMGLGPASFKSSMKLFKAKIKRNRRLARKLLRDGVDLTKEGDENGGKLDRLIAEGDEGNDHDEMKIVAAEYAQRGIRGEQRIIRMFNEGYLSRQRAQLMFEQLGLTDAVLPEPGAFD